MLMQDAMETRDVAKTKLISLRTEKVVAIHCKIEIFQNEKRLLLIYDTVPSIFWSYHTNKCFNSDNYLF